MRNRTRISSLDAFGLRDQRNRIYPALEASDGSTFSVDFTALSALDSRFTFTRSNTTSTFINSNGLIANAGQNVPRFDFSPTTLTSRGLLIESAATNLLQRSNAFNTSPWATNGYTHSTGSTSPHATESSQRLTVTSSGTLGNLQTTTVSSTSVVFSVWWKNGNWTGSTGSSPREIAIRNNTTATILLRFRIDTPNTVPTVGYITGSSGVSFQAFPNGWYRIVAFVNSGISSGNEIGVYLGGLLGSFIGSGEFADWYGAQLESGTVPTTYIPTTNSTVQRAADGLEITGTNFSAWWPSGISQWSAYWTGDLTRQNTSSQFLWRAQSGVNARSRALVTSALSIRAVALTTELNPSLNATVNTVFKVATGFQSENSIVWVHNGTTSANATDTVSVPLTDSDRINFNPTSTNFVHIRQFKFWPTRLSNTALQALVQ